MPPDLRTDDKDKPKGDGDKPALTAQSVAEIANAAISNQMTRAFESRDKKLVELIAEAVKPFSERLDKFEVKPDDQKPKATGNPKPDPQLLKLQETVGSLQNQLAERDNKDKERERHDLIKGQKSALKDALDVVGIRGVKARAAVALLHDDDGVIKRDDEGNVVMVFKRSGYDEELPLDKAMKEWVTTSYGKEFMPPIGAGGSDGHDSKVDLSQRTKDKNARMVAAKARLAVAHGILPRG